MHSKLSFSRGQSDGLAVDDDEKDDDSEIHPLRMQVVGILICSAVRKG